MYNWGELVGVVKFALSETQLESLRSLYIQGKHAIENF
jgi:hypothetical protein